MSASIPKTPKAVGKRFLQYVLIFLVVNGILVGMYIRTTKRKNKDGSTVTYYHLAHNIRHPETGQSTPQILYNFGRADKLDRQQLVRLCRSLARVCELAISDSTSPFEPSEECEKWLENLKLVQSTELGTVAVIEALWERLGIGDTLRDIEQKAGCVVPYERALLAMVANRACQPESKLGVFSRWLSTVYLPSCDKLSLHQMYEAMDLLVKHSDEVEEAIFFTTASLLELEVDIVFYDTTTVGFSIDICDESQSTGEEDALRQYGRPKDGSWSVQMVVALAVTRQGLPVRSWVLPGNTTDVTTVAKVKRDLLGWKLGRALFVGDSGFNSEANRHELAKACGTYLLATRIGSVNEVKTDVLSRPGRYRKITDNLHVKEVIVGGQGVRRRRYLVCYNKHEANRQSQRRQQVVEQLTAQLSKHKTQKATAQWASIDLLGVDFPNRDQVEKENQRQQAC